MKLKRRLFIAIALLGSIFFISSSISQAKEVRGVSDKSIKIGVILDQTGPIASLGVPMTQAIKNYARYTNERGGVHGRQLEIVVEDDRYSIPAAVAALKKLVSKDRVFAFIGPASGSLINVLWKGIQKNKLPSIAAPMPEITVKPYKKYIFITNDTYEGQVRVLVDYMVKDFKIKDPRVGVVYPDSEAGKIDRRAALPRLEKYGIKPVTEEILNAGSIDASSQVMSLKKNNVNCVLNVGTFTATTATLLRELKKFGVETIPIFNSWGAMLGEEINELGKIASQFYSVHGDSPWYGEGPGVEKMRGITLKYYPGTEKPYRGTVYTHGWIITSVLVEGLKRVGRNLDEDALISALEGLKNYDTGGLCGPISYSSTSHKGGDSWKIYRADPAEGKYVALTGWRKSE